MEITQEKLDEIRKLPLCTRLAQLRLLHGFRQKDLAKKMNVSVSSIVNWETESYVPSPQSIMKLANFYELPISYFMDDGIRKKYKRS